jgi:hypothetical protein
MPDLCDKQMERAIRRVAGELYGGEWERVTVHDLHVIAAVSADA